MTQTTTRPTVSANGTVPHPRTASSVASVPRRVHVPWVVAGVLLVAGCALAFAVASARVTTAKSVLVATQSLPAGTVLGPSDLRAVRLQGTAVSSFLPASAEASVLGRPLAVALVAGAPLSTAEVGMPTGLGTGEAVVALALKAGQYPPALATGDQVAVVPTPAPGQSAVGGSGSASAQSQLATATVSAIDTPPASSQAAVVVSLTLPEPDAAGVAQLEAAGEATLALVPARPAAGS